MRKKRMSIKDQCFLIDKRIVDLFCDSLKIRKREAILEIGAGTGNITKELLRRGAKVIAIEKDNALVKFLKKRFVDEKNLEIIHGDFLKRKEVIEEKKIRKICSAVPYSISRKLTEVVSTIPFSTGVFIYQKEFVEKINESSGSKKYRAISALVQTSFETEILKKRIRPNAFNPKPHVESAMIKLIQKKKVDEKYISFLKEAFSNKNKKIEKILSKEKCGPLLERLGKKRPYELSAEQFCTLYREFY